jgi:hypothetical protein
MGRRLVIRIGLLALAAPNVIVGAWLLFAPKSFYDSFPGFGRHWVGPLGAYDQHAFADFGGALLALALLCCLAALWVERRLVLAAALTVLCQSFAHFVYHLTRLGVLPTGDDIANQLSLAYGVVLSLWLIWLARRAAWGVSERQSQRADEGAPFEHVQRPGHAGSLRGPRGGG